MTIQLRTTAPSGLLMWSAGRGRGAARADFIALAVADGYPELSFRLGKDREVTTIKAQVSFARRPYS